MAKYKIKDLATDFGMSTKELSQVIEKFYEKPKSSSQSLEDDQLNVIFDYITQTNQIADISVVFAMAAAAPKAGPSKPSFVPDDIDTPVAAAQQPTKSADLTDIDEIFSIFKR